MQDNQNKKPNPEPRINTAPTESPIQRLAKRHPVLAATLIDTAAVGDIFKRSVKKGAEKQEREAKERPFVPPIEDYKPASPCAARWEDMSGADRFKLCSQCKLYMYDFDQVPEQDAQALIFKREGIAADDLQLFKRRDGRFLTSDCPIGKEAKLLKLKVGGGIAAAALVVVTVGVYAVTQYKPPVQSASSSSNVLSTSSSSGNKPSVMSGIQQALSPVAPKGAQKIASPPQKQGRPLMPNGKPIPKGEKYVVKYTKMEVFPGAPTVVVNLPLGKPPDDGVLPMKK